MLRIFEKVKSALDALARHPRFGWIAQFIKFGAVGVSNTCVHLGVYYLCLYAFGLHYQLCNLIAFALSVTNAYYWNSRYVFSQNEARDLRKRAAAYFKTVSGYGATYLLSIFLLSLWVETLKISESVAPLLNLCITIPLNYVINKFWTFAAGKKRSE